MRWRVLSTVGLWVGIIAIIFTTGVTGGVLLISALALLTQFEIYRLLARTGGRPCRFTGLAIGAMLLLAPHFLAGSTVWVCDGGILFLLGTAIFLLLALQTGRSESIETVFVPSLLGLFLGPYLLHFLILPATQLGTPGLAFGLWIIATAKFSDVGALLVGLKWGRHPFSPLSPKKTWEGIAGGVATGVVVGLLTYMLFADQLPAGFSAGKALLLAVPIVIFAIAGDLLESAMKRRAGVKDSGRLIPGIGGAFDLSDSLIWSAPIGYVIAFGWLL